MKTLMLLTLQFVEHTFYIRYNLFVNTKDLQKKFFGINRGAYLWTGFREIRKHIERPAPSKIIVDNHAIIFTS